MNATAAPVEVTVAPDDDREVVMVEVIDATTITTWTDQSTTRVMHQSEELAWEYADRITART